jgi:hypothetical protein
VSEEPYSGYLRLEVWRRMLIALAFRVGNIQIAL